MLCFTLRNYFNPFYCFVGFLACYFSDCFRACNIYLKSHSAVKRCFTSCRICTVSQLIFVSPLWFLCCWYILYLCMLCTPYCLKFWFNVVLRDNKTYYEVFSTTFLFKSIYLVCGSVFQPFNSFFLVDCLWHFMWLRFVGDQCVHFWSIWKKYSI